ncbi:NfeD family protein [Rhodanobacter sp. DHG33]|uniref:NfeD family protein n=1 Tax=Rhodanobacter sp. DHG33 TaxID=2775921 RepID=UPI001784C659|nr:NfeD family protein [Rhodanobacter sp. DHG33]MBD8899321.1 NfeD family protein [Rhodanobacter sp. DHG33]
MLGQIATHYLWWILALLLIAGEVMVPGYFLLWIGIAAAAMGVLLWLFPGLGLLTQAVLFAVLALAACLAYARWLRPRIERRVPGRERLNRRGEQMVGQRYVLIDPIVNGRGKVRVGDGQWLVSGPDLPLGSTVEVTAVDGTTLKVRAAP